MVSILSRPQYAWGGLRKTETGTSVTAATSGVTKEARHIFKNLAAVDTATDMPYQDNIFREEMVSGKVSFFVGIFLTQPGLAARLLFEFVQNAGSQGKFNQV